MRRKKRVFNKKPKSRINEPLLGIRENKVFLTGFNPNPYNRQELEELLKDIIPGYMNVVLPKAVYKGFAFIDLKTEEDVQKCLELGHVELEGHKMLIKEFKQGRDLKQERMSMNEKKVFIHQIPREWTVENLKEIFSQFGKLEEIYICFKKNDDQSDPDSIGSKIGFAIYKEKKVAEMIYSKGTVLFNNVVLKVKRVEDRGGVFDDDGKIHNESDFFGKDYGEKSIEKKSEKSIKGREMEEESLLKKNKALLMSESGENNPKGVKTEEKLKKEKIEVRDSEAVKIIKEGFGEVFLKLGINDFDFEEFMKFTAFQYLHSRKMMLERKQSDILRSQVNNGRIDFFSFFDNYKKEQELKNEENIKNSMNPVEREEYRAMVDYHATKPNMKFFYEYRKENKMKIREIDHGMRNIRINRGAFKVNWRVGNFRNLNGD